MKVKNFFKKLISISPIIIVILNVLQVLFGPVAYADQGDFAIDVIYVGLSAALGGWPLLLFYAIRLIVSVIALVVHGIMGIVLSIVEQNFNWAGLEDFIFAGAPGRSQFLSVNFFDLSTTNENILPFREGVAKWYYILRLISAAILLVMLIYVGIRMALSTVASEQAKYKKMLVDWASSMALLFLLHYIIIFVIEINDALVASLARININSFAWNNVFDILVNIRSRRAFSCSSLLYICWNVIYIFYLLYKTYDNSWIFNYDFSTYNDYICT